MSIQIYSYSAMNIIKQQIKNDIIKFIVNNIDDKLNLFIKDEDFTMANMKNYMLNDPADTSFTYTPNEYGYGDKIITLPTNKFLYLQIVGEVLAFFEEQGTPLDFDIDINDLFKNDEQLMFLYVWMMFDVYKNEAFREYINTNYDNEVNDIVETGIVRLTQGIPITIGTVISVS